MWNGRWKLGKIRSLCGFEFDQFGILIHGTSLLYQYVPHAPFRAGQNIVFHFHGFENEHRGRSVNFVSHGNLYRADEPWHGCLYDMFCGLIRSSLFTNLKTLADNPVAFRFGHEFDAVQGLAIAHCSIRQEKYLELAMLRIDYILIGGEFDDLAARRSNIAPLAIPSERAACAGRICQIPFKRKCGSE